jgi:hypothetical protein
MAETGENDNAEGLLDRARLGPRRKGIPGIPRRGVSRLPEIRRQVHRARRTVETREGSARELNVVVEYKDRATAVACYDSPEYQAAKVIREKYADADFIIIDGAGD